MGTQTTGCQPELLASISVPGSGCGVSSSFSWGLLITWLKQLSWSTELAGGFQMPSPTVKVVFDPPPSGVCVNTPLGLRTHPSKPRFLHLYIGGSHNTWLMMNKQGPLYTWHLAPLFTGCWGALYLSSGGLCCKYTTGATKSPVPWAETQVKCTSTKGPFWFWEE